MRVIVVGQGYVGLPVAMRAVEVGHDVVGVDVDVRRVGALAKGVSYVDDIADATVTAALESGRYSPTDSYEALGAFDVAVITVPTPLKGGLPDLSFIESTAHSLAPHLVAGATVVLESTTYPGTTEELLVPILEAGSGLRAGFDFHVGYSPERIDPGNPQWGFVETPKVVSGIDAESLTRVKGFYDSLVQTTVPVSGTREAELTKLLENTFRHVNIALVNELAIFAHQLGVDVWESIEAAGTKPFGFMKFTPGPGVGGHCLPVDPSYLSWKVRETLGETFRFVELANGVNEHMPRYVVARLQALLTEREKVLEGATVLLVGLAYKANTGDTRESPSLAIIDMLIEAGATVLAADDQVESYRWPALAEHVPLDVESLMRADIAVVLTIHRGMDLEVLRTTATPVFDTRGMLPSPAIRL